MRRQRQRRHRRRLREAQAARGEGVDDGRRGGFVAVAAEPIRAQRIDADEQHRARRVPPPSAPRCHANHPAANAMTTSAAAAALRIPLSYRGPQHHETDDEQDRAQRPPQPRMGHPARDIAPARAAGIEPASRSRSSPPSTWLHGEVAGTGAEGQRNGVRDVGGDQAQRREAPRVEVVEAHRAERAGAHRRERDQQRRACAPVATVNGTSHLHVAGGARQRIRRTCPSPPRHGLRAATETAGSARTGTPPRRSRPRTKYTRSRRRDGAPSTPPSSSDAGQAPRPQPAHDRPVDDAWRGGAGPTRPAW